MNSLLMRLWRRSCSPLMVTFAFLPAPLFLVTYCAPDFLPLVWLWPAGYFLLDLCSTFVRGKWRILYAFLEIAAMAAPAALIGDKAMMIWVYLIPPLYIILLLMDLPLPYEGRSDQTRLLRYAVVGVLIHLAAQILLSNTSAEKFTGMDSIRPWLLGGFFLFIILGLMMLNQAALQQSSGSRLHITGVMKLKNGLLTGAFLILSLVLALIPAIVTGVSAFFRWISLAVQELMTFLGGLIVTKPKEDAQTGGSDINFGDTGGSGGGVETNDTLVTIIVLTLLAVAVGFLVFFLVRSSIRFAKFLRKQLKKYLNAVSEDYVDEITDTRDDAEHQRARQKFKERKLSKSDLRKLPPEQQIRHRYKLLMRQHPQWHRGSTARENLNPAAASVYEQARYSKHPVAEADAQRFAEETKTL
ncbi:MAG: hypothetical protein IJB47_00230 [Oscillospiraceae bacterium]|nr:hypothetical protein [Oscillospiraceae bacterium]